MAKYRIKETVFGDGSKFFEAQKRSWFSWVDIPQIKYDEVVHIFKNEDGSGFNGEFGEKLNRHKRDWTIPLCGKDFGEVKRGLQVYMLLERKPEVLKMVKHNGLKYTLELSYAKDDCGSIGSGPSKCILVVYEIWAESDSGVRTKLREAAYLWKSFPTSNLVSYDQQKVEQYIHEKWDSIVSQKNKDVVKGVKYHPIV